MLSRFTCTEGCCLAYLMCDMASGTMCFAFAQASTPWRKAAAKPEGEPEFEDLSKTDRLEVYEDYIK